MLTWLTVCLLPGTRAHSFHGSFSRAEKVVSYCSVVLFKKRTEQKAVKFENMGKI